MLWQFTCNRHGVLDVNNAFANNSLQFNPDFQAFSALAGQQTATNASINFTDLLASAQAESEQLQDGTISSSGMGQTLLSANPSLNSIPTNQSAGVGSSSLYGALRYSSQLNGSQLNGSQLNSSPLNSNNEDTPVEQSQTSSQPAADTQEWPTGNSDPSLQASSPSAADETDSSAPEAQASDPVLSAVSNPSSGQVPKPLNASANFKSQALASGQPVLQPATAAGSASQVVTPDPQGQTGPARTSSVGVPLIQPASGFSRTSANQKAPATHSSVPDQPEAVALSAGASAKSPDKVKARKESAAAEAKSNAGTVISGAGTEPATSTCQADSISNSAAAIVSADSIMTTSEAAPKSSGGGKAGSNSDLAFALKIQGNDPAINLGNQANLATMAASDHSDPGAQTTASAFSAEMTASIGISEPGILGPKADPKGASSDLPGSAITGQININALALAPSSVNSSATASQNTAPAENTAPASALPDDHPVTVQPVKTVQVQISGADDQKVDLKLVEKSGALTMSVRSSDASLTKSLQQNLPDLTTKLSDQQIRAEWWRPDTQQTDGSKNSGNSSSGGNGSANQGQANQDQGNQNKGNSGQQGGRGTAQPDWLEDLAASNTSNQNGTQFTWHL